MNPVILLRFLKSISKLGQVSKEWIIIWVVDWNHEATTILLIDDRNERVEPETAWPVLTTCSNQEDMMG